MAIDPVCGLFVRESPSALAAEVRGRTYHFCSPTCWRRFSMPEREVAWSRRFASLALGAGALLMALPLLGLIQEPWLGWVLLAIATPIQVLAGWPFYQGVRAALAQRAANLDTLAAIGTTAAWLFGAIEVLSPQALVAGRQQYYFEVGALVLGFLLVGRMLEQRLRREAGDEVQRLMELQPRTARVLRDGAEAEIGLEELQVGDMLLLRAGERAGADGVVREGRSAVDEKHLTGEALPVDKGVGDKLMGGSVNVSAPLRVEVTHVGAQTALSKIVGLIERAQSTTPKAARYADIVSSWFVPAVLGAAALSFVAWQAMGASLATSFSVMVAVLLVASPAAVSLATPAVLVVGVAKAARRGILIKGAGILERVAQVDRVVWDKTGTLTRGEPALTDVRAFGGDEPRLLRLAASAEQSSDHPLARTMTRAAQAKGLKLTEPKGAQSHTAAGVEATIGKEDVLVGSRLFLTERRIDTRPAEEARVALTKQGKTVVLVALDEKVAGVVAFADPVRPESAEAVQRLRAMGVESALVTGDNAATAGAVASELGIRRVFAEITPQGKAASVRAFQEGSHVVAMVGDGINDAPALAGADVGIAIGAGSEVALEAADVVLMRSDPRDVPAVLQLAREASERIRQNLRWAFVYHAALVPIAALGLLNPLLAGLAMAFSSVPIVLNARKVAQDWDAADAAHPNGNGDGHHP